MPSNPYRFSGPIREAADFYGRARELRHIFERIHKRESVNIIGERRSGKTSLLLHLLHSHVQQQYIPDSQEELLYVYLDAETVPQSPEGFFHDLLAQTRARYPGLPAIPPDQAASEQGVRAFLEALAPRRLVLLMDEFEGISSCADFPPRFFMFLRGLNIGYNLSFVVATCNRLSECCPIEIATSPFPNIFKGVELGPFAPEEMAEFLCKTSASSGVPLVDLQDSIERLAGHYPYLVQMACWHYFETWVERGQWDQQAHEIAQRRFIEEAGPYFKAMWERYLAPDEKQALCALVAGEAADSQVIWRLERRGHVRDGQVASQVLAELIARQDGAPAAPGEAAPRPPAQPPSQGLWVDEESGQVYLDGELLDPPLPDRQYQLLKLLYQNAGTICTPYMIIQAVWSEEYIDQVDDQRIAQLTSRLRKRVEPGGKPWKYILTVHGRGLTLGQGNAVQDADAEED
ncbi:MAG: AAA family ATPase [Chloroflexi bacterium]|jgi:DNA-binding winged helix-turn-helix (wHTH) protein/energy-coupling factor transporter ATP-binding protein EcfA2|nr:AAA family ATPase [Chloroflexota bacterium]